MQITVSVSSQSHHRPPRPATLILDSDPQQTVARRDCITINDPIAQQTVGEHLSENILLLKSAQLQTEQVLHNLRLNAAALDKSRVHITSLVHTLDRALTQLKSAEGTLDYHLHPPRS